MKTPRITILALAVAGLCAGATRAAEPATATESALFVLADAGTAGTPRALAIAGLPELLEGGHMTRFLSTEMGDGGKVVRDAPYSAEAVTETTQTLGDGTRISRRTAALLYRDALGRTRQEQTAPGASVFINDPVAGKRTVLNADRKTATVLPDISALMQSIEGGRFAKLADAGKVRVIHGASGGTQIVRNSTADGETQIINEPGRQIVIRRKEIAGGDGTKTTEERKEVRVSVIRAHDGDEAIAMAGMPPDLHSLLTLKSGKNRGVTTSLGVKDVGGVRAEGTQTVVTIPAGEIGNDRPIRIISEKWFSPELQAVVYSRHSDPRSGETIYRLDNIRRAPQPAELFAVPQGYTIKESPLPPVPPTPPTPPTPSTPSTK